MTTLFTYLNMPHNQIVTVPNGTYTGSTTLQTAPNPPGGGKYNGWLILVAQTHGSVIVDAGTELHLGPGSWKVLFVGFSWQNVSNGLTAGLYFEGATDVDLWYPDMTNPVDGSQLNGSYRPRNITVRDHGSQFRIFGGRNHDVGDNAIINYADSIHIEGHRIDNVGPIDSSGQDRWHVNSFTTTNGWVTNLNIVSSFIGERFNIDTHPGTGADTTLNVSNSWVNAPNSRGFDLYDRANANTPSIHGALANVYVFNTAGPARGDNYRDGSTATTPPYNNEPQYINVTDFANVQYGVTPPGGTQSPEVIWQAAHPYASWQTFPSFDYLTGGGTTKLWIDSTGPSPGTLGSNYTTGTYDFDFGKADGSVPGILPDYGHSARMDVRVSQIQSGGGYARYDNELDRMVNNGVTTLIICYTDAGSYAVGGGSSEPNIGNLAALQTSWQTTYARYVARYPSITILHEFWNEPQGGSPMRDASGNFNVDVWVLWCNAWLDAILGVDSTALCAISAFAPQGPTTDIRGSNLYSATGGGTRNMAPLDIVRNALFNPNNILGGVTPVDPTRLGWIAWHAYWGQHGPLTKDGINRVDTTTNAIVTWPSMPKKYNPSYNSNTFRQTKDAYQYFVNAGGDPALKIHATETGGTSAPYYNASRAYNAGDGVFAAPGTPDNVNRLWTRAQLRTRNGTGAGSSGHPPSDNTYWTTPSSYAGFSPIGYIAEEDENGAYANWAQRVFMGADADQDGTNIGPITGSYNWYNQRDLFSPNSAGEDFGIVSKELGTIKGSPSNDGFGNGVYGAFVRNADNVDTRSGVVTPPTTNDYDAAGVLTYE